MKHGRARYADFIGIPRKVADSAAFKALPPMARALYLDLRRQHTGYNNGAIAAVMQGSDRHPGLAALGWAPRSVFKFVKVLLKHGLIEKTRQGGIASMSKICTLYGFTDLPIVANKEKGVEGRQPSLAYLQFESRKRDEAARHAAIDACRARTQLHVMPNTPSTTARGAACDSAAKGS